MSTRIEEANMSDDMPSLDNFSGVARLFPLPNLVLFPGVVQPLHIFEPRYRKMMADALDGDRLLAIVLLQPGWEEDYDNRPPIHRVACLGRIFDEERLANGRYNLLLHGLRRIRIDEELPPDRLYREAHVQLLEDVISSEADREEHLRAELLRVLPPLLDTQGGAGDQALKLLEGDLPLGTITDVFTFALPFESARKQELLEELDVARRTERFLAELSGFKTATADEKPQKFPPDFSVN
jgi:Lon protease-like protein